MLSGAVAALAWLCVANCSPAGSHALRAHAHAFSHKDFSGILTSVEERLKVLETISVAQIAQGRRLDVIQDKLDRMETTLSLRLERAQLAAERLEHRLHMLQTSVQATIKENSAKIIQSEQKIAEIAQNMTKNIDSHRTLLEKVNGAYTETWRRGIVLESMMRDGLSLVNVTRRELADGLRALGRRQRDARLSSADLEAAVSRRLDENNFKLDNKIQEVLEMQKRFVDSCQRVQHDDPTRIEDTLEKMFDVLINKTAYTLHELQSIQATIRNHDSKVMKILNSARLASADATCKRLENTFKNSSQTLMRESDLQQLTEKFIALTDRADAVVQKLESRLNDGGTESSVSLDVTSAADRLLTKLKSIRSEEENEDELWEDGDEQDSGYFDIDDEGDIMGEDRIMLNEMNKRNKQIAEKTSQHHRRHLHKHPYDRGPKSLKSP